MKKFIVSMLVIIFCIVITACNGIELSMANNIVSPLEKNPLIGQWSIERYISKGGEDLKIDETFKNTYMIFSEDFVEFPDVYYENINYKVKMISALQYMQTTYGITPSVLGITSDTIEVMTINYMDIYVKDIIIMSEDKAIMDYYGGIVYLNKVRGSEESVTNIEPQSNDENYKALNSGVLLGIRRDYKDKNEKSTYRTIWVTNEGEVSYVKDTDILLPRKSGFWEVDTDRSLGPKGYKDNIEIYPINKSNILSRNVQDKYNGEIVNKAITFVGNDYICIEIEEVLNNIHLNYLKTMPIDGIYNNEEYDVNLQSIINKENINVYVKLKGQENINSMNISNLNKFTNFGIRRVKGMWRFYTIFKNEGYIDVDIPTMVPNTLSRHDELYTSWNSIINIIPSAIDAIASPNGNMLIIQTKNNLYIYKVKDNNISHRPMAVVPLEDDESIIMAEWALGEYVNNWSDMVKTINEKNK